MSSSDFCRRDSGIHWSYGTECSSAGGCQRRNFLEKGGIWVVPYFIIRLRDNLRSLGRNFFMSARTYVCLHCRWSRRAEAAYGLNTNFRCPTCGGSLWELEWRWRIPRKTNDKGWKELEMKVSRDAAVIVPWRRRTAAAKIAKLDSQIANVERQRESVQKIAKLKKLRNERTRTLIRYG